jgi:hypothetical protein
MAIAGPTIAVAQPNDRILFSSTLSGLSADRPTSGLPVRWIGMPFYDTTLGKPIFLHSVNPDVWHDGAGAVV